MTCPDVGPNSIGKSSNVPSLWVSMWPAFARSRAGPCEVHPASRSRFLGVELDVLERGGVDQSCGMADHGVVDMSRGDEGQVGASDGEGLFENGGVEHACGVDKGGSIQAVAIAANRSHM